MKFCKLSFSNKIIQQDDERLVQEWFSAWGLILHAYGTITNIPSKTIKQKQQEVDQ